MTTVNELRFLQDPSLFITTADIYIYIYIFIYLYKTYKLSKQMEHRLYCSKIYCKQTIAIRSIFFFLVPEMKEKNKKPYHNY